MATEGVSWLVAGVPAGLELGLRNYWYPVLPSAELGAQPLALRLLGEELVAWRDAAGAAHVFADCCPHRAARLSIGRVVGDHLQCIFHGLQFDASGRCALMPWQPDGRPRPDTLRAAAYPVVERQGLVFAYLGDIERFPPPPARDELPADLWDDDAVGYVLTETWNANWLLALDGADRYHLPVLHARSAVQTDEAGRGGGEAVRRRGPKATLRRGPKGPAHDDGEAGRGAAHDAAGRRLAVAAGEHRLQVSVVDAAGASVVTGMEADAQFADQGFHLPALLALAVQAQRGTAPYRIFLWLFAVDAERTQVTRWISRRAATAAERAEWARFYERTVRPRTLQVSSEDAMVAESQRGLVFARTHERLLPPDGEIYQRRLLLRDAFLAQLEGRRLPSTIAARRAAG